jgi:hypothetical protein
VKTWQPRDVFSPLPEERFELAPLDCSKVSVPPLDRLLMQCGEGGRLMNKRVPEPKQLQQKQHTAKRKARRKQVA